MAAGVFDLAVLVPYKITLLSNTVWIIRNFRAVLVPYKITLLSNCGAWAQATLCVLVPYKITLLSNSGVVIEKYRVF